MEENDIIKRIRFLIENSGLSVNAYAKKVGVCAQNLYVCLKGRVPAVELLQKILVAFPDVSAEWLLMGEGRMKRDDMEFMKEQIRIKDEQIEGLIKKLK